MSIYQRWRTEKKYTKTQKMRRCSRVLPLGDAIISPGGIDRICAATQNGPVLHYSLYATPFFSTSLLMRKGTLILRAVASLSGGADTRFLAFKNPPWYRALASVREIPGTCDRGEETSQKRYHFPSSTS